MKYIAPQEFVMQAVEIFAPLLGSFDFVHSSSMSVDDYSVVVFKSGRLFFRVKMTMPDYVPAIDFGVIGVDDQPDGFPLDIGDLLTAVPGRPWQWRKAHGDPVAELKELRRFMETEGRNVLQGSAALFDAMRNNRKRLLEEWHAAEAEKTIRNQADQLWQNGRRPEAAALYSKLKNPTPVESAKAAAGRKTKPGVGETGRAG